MRQRLEGCQALGLAPHTASPAGLVLVTQSNHHTLASYIPGSAWYAHRFGVPESSIEPRFGGEAHIHVDVDKLGQGSFILRDKKRAAWEAVSEGQRRDWGKPRHAPILVQREGQDGSKHSQGKVTSIGAFAAPLGKLAGAPQNGAGSGV